MDRFSVDNEIVSSIGRGVMVLVGIGQGLFLHPLNGKTYQLNSYLDR